MQSLVDLWRVRCHGDARDLNVSVCHLKTADIFISGSTSHHHLPLCGLLTYHFLIYIFKFYFSLHDLNCKLLLTWTSKR